MLDKYSKMEVSVLGGAGFIGSHLVEKLLSLGASVTIIDGFIPGTGASKSNLQGLAGNFRLIEKPIADIETLPEIASKADLLIDAMGLTSHSFGLENPQLDIECNLMSHLHLLQALKTLKHKKLIYLGSRSQYGRSNGGDVNEETSMIPLDVQGINKLSAEHYYRVFSEIYKLNVISLRVTNCYGPRQKTEGDDIGLVGSFIRDAIQEKPIHAFGSEKRIKSLIYVEDLCNIILLSGLKVLPGFSVFNVAGRETTLGSLLENVVSVCQSGAYSVKPFPDHLKLIDVGNSRFSGKRLQNFLGDIELSDSKEALQKTVAYFKNRASST